MLTTIKGLILFLLVEWIKYKKNIKFPLVRQEVGHNAKKQRHQVRSKSALRTMSIQNNKPQYMRVLMQTLIL